MYKVYSTTYRVMAGLGTKQDNGNESLKLSRQISQAVEVDMYTRIVRPIREDIVGWAVLPTVVPWCNQRGSVFAPIDRPYFRQA